ncbi:MAG: hypothetical protein ACRD01_10620, partial [Terriglobales bacterium]
AVALLRALQRRGAILALIVGASLAAGWAASACLTPVYSAEAGVEVQSPAPAVSFAPEPAPQEPSPATVTSLAEELGSRARLAAALAQLTPAARQALMRPLWRWPQGRTPAPAPSREELLRTARQRLEVVPVADSHTIQLTFAAPGRGVAVAMLQALLGAEVASLAERNLATGQAHVATLAARVATAATAVTAAQQQLTALAAGAGLTDPAQQLQLANQRWQQLASAETDAEISALRQAESLPETPAPGAVASPEAAPVSLELERAQAAANVSRLAALYRPEAAPLRQAERQLASLDASLAAWRQNQMGERRQALAAVRRQAGDLAQALAKQRRAETRLLQVNDRYALGVRRLEARQDTYTALLGQLQRAIAEAGDTGLPLRVSDQPAPAARLRPRLAATMFYAAVLGTLLGLATMLAMERWADGVRLPEAAEMTVPLAAVLPERTGLEFASELAGCAAALLLAQADTGLRTVWVTGVDIGEGKTTVATGLARQLAQVSSAVLLLDANWRRCSAAGDPGMEPEAPGLAELLSGAARIEQVLRRLPAAETGAVAAPFYIPAGHPEPPARLAVQAAAGALAELLAAARARYDWIIADGGGLFEGPEGAVWANLADCTLLVARAGHSSRRRLQHGLDLLLASGAPSVGLVLNRSRAPDRHHLSTMWLAHARAQPAPAAVATMRQRA